MTMLADALSGAADLFVPAFEVLIGQQKLDRRMIRDVLEVSFHDSIEEMGGFSLMLANWDADRYTYAYSDEHIFDPGKRLDINMYTEGYKAGNAKKLPLNLLDALRALERSTVLNEALGAAVVNSYVKLKHDEWNAYSRHLTEWERQTTLDC